MRHPKAVAWEKKLRRVFDRIDDTLEDKYGKMYRLHPARARRGATSSKRQDGLFSIGASFSAGYGSRLGRGYIVRIRLVTLASVPAKVREKIHAEMVKQLRQELPRAFPGRKLKVARDGQAYKIYGDLSLGRV